MPSTRRLRVLGVAVITCVVLLLYFTSKPRQSHSHDFYSRTVQRMREQEAEKMDMGDERSERLKYVERVARKAAGDSLPNHPDKVVAPGKRMPGAQKTVAGRKKMGHSIETVKTAEGQAKKVREETDEEHETEVELGSILKRSPIIIFSKTYCPYSQRAKHLLLEKYTIVPAPFVVELNEHPLGQRLQDELGKGTGRRTVPNVLVNGKSIGGGDDIAALDAEGKLLDKIRAMAGKRIMELRLTDIK